MRGTFGIILSIVKASEIRNDPERRKNTVRFGVFSVIYAVIAVPLACLMLIFPSLMQGSGALLVIFNIAILLIGAGGSIICLLQSLFNFILQVTINRKPVTWIALAVFAICTAASIYIAVYALSLI